MYDEGKLTRQQMEDLIVRQLKQQKIFGFGSYEEFFGDYFRKDLVAVEEMNRVNQIINARKNYGKRASSRF